MDEEEGVVEVEEVEEAGEVDREGEESICGCEPENSDSEGADDEEVYEAYSMLLPPPSTGYAGLGTTATLPTPKPVV